MRDWTVPAKHDGSAAANLASARRAAKGVPHDWTLPKVGNWKEPSWLTPARAACGHRVSGGRRSRSRSRGKANKPAAGANGCNNWLVSKVEKKAAPPGVKPVASLRLDTLSVASSQSCSASNTTYAANGKNLNRIKRVLSGAAFCCSASCKQSCRKQFKESEVSKICDLFWSLGRQEQAYLIHCIKEDAGCIASPVDTSRPAASRWAFGEKTVCFDAWCALLGTTKRTILKMVHGEDDERCSSSGRVPGCTFGIRRALVQSNVKCVVAV